VCADVHDTSSPGPPTKTQDGLPVTIIIVVVAVVVLLLIIIIIIIVVIIVVRKRKHFINLGVKN